MIRIQPKRLGAALTAAALCLAAPTLAHAGTKVEVTTPLGKIVMELRPQDAPITVANFLKYIGDGDYEDSIIHRSAYKNISTIPQEPEFVPFVIQGGGFYPIDEYSQLFNHSYPQVPTDPAITNEPGVSNTRGTVAMARSSGVNSATSQWFINLSDNSFLDTQNEGFTVFADVIEGMEVADAISALSRWNLNARPDPEPDLQTPFNEIPLLPSFTGSLPWSDEDFVTTSFRVIGDTDGDADIDDFDLINAIVGYTGSLTPGTGTATYADGDVDGDGDVDDFDLIGMIVGYTGSFPVSAPPVPEPGALALLGLGATALTRRRR